MSMRKLFTSVICVGALLALSATSGYADNLLTNPGFETGDLTGWQVFGLGGNSAVPVVADNGPSGAGSYCAYMDNHAEALGLTLKQSLTPGMAIAGTVAYSFDIKLGQAALGGVFFVQIFAEKSGVGIVGISPLLGNYAPAGWTTITGNWMAPLGTDFLTIQFMANTGANVGSVSTMYVDNVNLDQGTTVVSTETTTWGNIKSLYR